MTMSRGIPQVYHQSQAAGLLWTEPNKRPVFLKFRSSTGLIGVTAFVAAFTVCF